MTAKPDRRHSIWRKRVLLLLRLLLFVFVFYFISLVSIVVLYFGDVPTEAELGSAAIMAHIIGILAGAGLHFYLLLRSKRIR